MMGLAKPPIDGKIDPARVGDCRHADPPLRLWRAG
jgi:hypothetical protein